MRSASPQPRLADRRLLPRGWRDLVAQVLIFAVTYAAYQLVRGLVSTGSGYRPFGDATRIIAFERALHVFVEPDIQAWTSRSPWLMNLADWTYLNAHYLITPAALLFLYLRRNRSYYRVRDTFVVAMGIALLGYTLFPTAPPRLMPEWGFSDSISRFLHATVSIDNGPSKLFVNFTAAVPSMHVCMAAMIGWPLSRLARHWPAKLVWAAYPAWISFVVVATANHYLVDVALGLLTAGLAAAIARRRRPAALAAPAAPPELESWACAALPSPGPASGPGRSRSSPRR